MFEDIDIDNSVELIEFIAPIISFPLIALYHISLIIEVILNPYRTTFGTNYHERRFWAIKVLTKEGNEIMGVQSIRNSMFTSTVLASTAVAVMFGILQTIIPLSNNNEIPAKQYYIALLLVGVLLFAFIFLSLAIRSSSHASTLCCCQIWKIEQIQESGASLPPDIYSRTLDQRLNAVIGHLNSITIHYSLGMRCFYLCIPITVWILGPWWLILGTILLIIALYLLDHGYA